MRRFERALTREMAAGAGVGLTALLAIFSVVLLVRVLGKAAIGDLDVAAVISMPDKWEYPWYAAWDLAFHVQQVANNTASHFLDAAKHCTVSAIDGIHLDEAGHLALGQAIAEKINTLKL